MLMTTEDAIHKWDGHTHSPFCRHGVADSLDSYIHHAIRQGFTRYTVTEHPPLPEGWLRDQGVMQELAMDWKDLSPYLKAVETVKSHFAERIEVRTGLEIDYLHDLPSFTQDILEACATTLQEAIVSVHFLPGQNGMRCIDLTTADFCEGLVHYYGGMEQVIEQYFDHVESAIRFAAALPFPTRIGHLTLIEKFRLELPPYDEGIVHKRLEAILPLLCDTGVGVDVNVAGLRKSSCQRAYVPVWFIKRAAAMHIPLIYGSDAHQFTDVGANWDWFTENTSASPQTDKQTGGISFAGR